MVGIYRAKVVDNVDPFQKMRLKVLIPSLGPTAEWAMPCVPVDSIDLPEVEALVWVMFEDGDAAHPVWVGTLGGAQ